MPIPEKNMSLVGIFIATMAFFIFSTGDAIIKYLGATYHATQILFFIHAFACMLIMFYLAFCKTPIDLFPKHPKWMALRCVVLAMGAPAVFYAFTHLPLTEVYVIGFAMPILIIILAMLILGERIGMYGICAIILGFTGVFIVLNPTELSRLNLGHAGILFAISCGALNVVIIRKLRNDENPVTMIAYPFLAVTLSGLVIMPPYYTPLQLLDMALLGVAAAIFLSASYCMVIAHRYTEATTIAPLQYTQMIWALLFSVYIFNEATPERVFYGLPFIVMSGLMILYGESKSSHHKNAQQKKK